MEVHSHPATAFIYGLWDPRDSQLRYIGKTNNPKTRLKQHISAAQTKNSKHKSRLWRWIRVLLDLGLRPEFEVLTEVPFSEWEIEEKTWIAECRANGLDLVNLTDGGIGFKGGKFQPDAIEKISRASSSRKMTEEQRKACSERNPWRGKQGWMAGKKFTDEHKRKISESRVGEKNPCWGRKQSKEEIESHVARLRGVPRTPEVREKIGAAQRGKKKPPEKIAKRLETFKSRSHPCSEETKAKISAFHKGRVHSAEHNEKIREAWRRWRIRKGREDEEWEL